MTATLTDSAPLFEPFDIGALHLPNRLAMAPMTRKFAPSGVPGQDVVDYYRRRAEAGIGLIITEATYIDHPNAGQERNIPHMTPGASEAGWKKVVDAVHQAGARIFSQLWHLGAHETFTDLVDPSIPLVGPSGITGTGKSVGAPLTERQVEEIIEAYASSAALAQKIGFDGIEIHAGHGYLIDQFFWDRTNLRSDRWGGKDLLERSRFAHEVVAACRRATAPDFPISFRFSQWKIVDYTARLAETPQELERFLGGLSDAGVDVFHSSTRRFWQPEFEGSDLGLAGWAKKLTGKPSIAVGSVTLQTDLYQEPTHAEAADLDRLMEMFARGDFDSVAVGRAIIANPDWADLVRRNAVSELKPFDQAASRVTLY